MCGIAGVLKLFEDHPNSNGSIKIVKDLMQSIRHRGPDSSGIWSDPNHSEVVLGHRRLSVLDVSDDGAQPMHSVSGQYTIVFNGEIYNFRELRAGLGSSSSFRGNSDTEVILALIESEGLEQAISKLRGMFAFAVWDRKTKELFIARDRFGEKPLYYGMIDQSLVFCSEVGGLERALGHRLPLEPDAVSGYFRRGYVPAPLSIYRGVFKLPPASYCRIKVLEDKTISVGAPVPYWNLKPGILTDNSFKLQNYEEATAEFSSRFESAVRSQMVSDVPLGTFLSGGYDSTAIVSAMCAQSNSVVKTFTVGFDDPEHDESQFARQVAEYLGTQHEEFIVTHDQVLQEAENIAAKYDEPFSDPSQIPTYLVAKAARQRVTVCLSGDGGDELLGGYSRFEQVSKIHKYAELIPLSVRKKLAAFANSQLHQPSYLTNRIRFDRPLKLLSLLGYAEQIELYKKFTTNQGSDYVSAEHNKTEAPIQDLADVAIKGSLSAKRQMMWRDTHTYLPDDILVKVDRAAMASSLETRAPFLDSDLAEWVWGCPDSFLFPNNGKRLLKSYVHSKVPRALVERKKSGFSVPLASWLRGPLRDWWQDIVKMSFDLGNDWLDRKKVDEMWRQHQSGVRNWHYALWNIVMFCDWHRRRFDLPKQ